MPGVKYKEEEEENISSDISFIFIFVITFARPRRERERELRTVLLKDRDFRHLPILTMCPCYSTCQYIHDNSQNIDYHNTTMKMTMIILVTKLIRNKCEKHYIRERERERESRRW